MSGVAARVCPVAAVARSGCPTSNGGAEPRVEKFSAATIALPRREQNARLLGAPTDSLGRPLYARGSTIHPESFTGCVVALKSPGAQRAVASRTSANDAMTCTAATETGSGLGHALLPEQTCTVPAHRRYALHLSAGQKQVVCHDGAGCGMQLQAPANASIASLTR